MTIYGDWDWVRNKPKPGPLPEDAGMPPGPPWKVPSKISDQDFSDALDHASKRLRDSDDEDFKDALDEATAALTDALREVRDEARTSSARARIDNEIDDILRRDPPDALPGDPVESAPGKRRRRSNRRAVGDALGDDYLGSGDETATMIKDVAKAADGDPGAMMKIMNKLFESFGDRLAKFWEGTVTGVSSITSPLHKRRFGETVGGFVGGSMEGAGQQLQALPGGEAGGQLLEGLGRLSRQAFEATDRLRDWSTQLHETDMQFKEYSGTMAGVAARQEVRDILLSQERGERRGRAAEFLARERFGAEKAVAPWEDLSAKIQDALAGTMDRGFARILAPFGPLAERLNQAFDKYLGEQEDDPNAEQMIRDAAAFSGDFDTRGRPKRFAPPSPPNPRYNP
jgi:hypothetical protein